MEVFSIEEESSFKNEMYEDVKTAWMNERNSPELLPHVGAVLDELIKCVSRQDDNYCQQSSVPEELFITNLQQIEAERARYISIEYLRTRLLKIEKMSYFLASNPSEKRKLSDAEEKYLESYEKYVSSHYNSFLENLPKKLHHFRDEVYSGPDLDSFVFCRVLDETDAIEVHEKLEPINPHSDDVWLLRYAPIRRLLHDKTVQLL